jgi:uncharacterized membrane protein
MADRISARKVRCIIEGRIDACRAAEARYESMAQEPFGGIMGSVDLAKQARATEQCARMELELVLRLLFPTPSPGRSGQ